MKRACSLMAIFVGALAGTACGGAPVATHGPEKVDLPATDGLAKTAEAAAPARERPPPSGVAKESPFPSIARSKLPNGLEVAVVTSRALPIVQLRVLVKAGPSYGELPGIGELTAQMLKDGGTRSMPSSDVLRRVETLGSDLSVRTEADATVVGMAVTTDKLDSGLAILSEVVREPRFDASELNKTKARAIDETEDSARASGTWTASRILWSELYPERSPYHAQELLPSQIAKIDGAKIRDFHRKFFVPANTTLIFAGDVDEPSAKRLAERHFGPWSGGLPPTVTFTPPRLSPKTRVIVAHRPKSAQSDVFVAVLAPPRSDERWPRVRIATQILGGGFASRLFADVREERSLAYRTLAQVQEVAHGPQPLVLYAGTQSSKTAEAVIGLLENIERMQTTPPTSLETETARRYLSDVFAIRQETVGSIAEMVATQAVLGLPDGYWEAYRKDLRATDAKDVAAVVPTLFEGKPVIVVAGDADVIGGELSKLGDVTVVDPEKEFKTIKTIPAATK